MRRRSWWILLAVALAPALAAYAADAPQEPVAPKDPEPVGKSAPPSPSEAAVVSAADAAVAAHGRDDTAALSRLASADNPDPWLVADELVYRGALAVAEAFARASPRPDIAGLPDYLVSRRGKPDDPARRERVAAAQAAFLAQRPADALTALGPPETSPPDDVIALRLHGARGLALAQMGRWPEALPSLQIAFDGAERFGWFARAATLLDLVGRATFETSGPAGVVGVAERFVALFERRAQPDRVAAGLAELGRLRVQTGNRDGGIDAYRRAAAAWTQLKDARRAAATLAEGATLVFEAGDLERATPIAGEALAAFDALRDDALTAEFLLVVGAMHKSRGDVEAARDAWQRSLTLSEAIQDTVGAGGALVNLGQVYVDGPLADPAKAVELLERGLTLAEAGDQSEWASHALRALIRLYTARGDRRRAAAYWARDLALHEATRDAPRLAAAVVDFGLWYAKGPPESVALALPLLERGERLASDVGRPDWVLNAVRGKAVVYELTGRPADALSAFASIRRTLEARGDIVGAAGAMLGAGRAHHALGDGERGITLHQEAIRLLETQGPASAVADALNSLARLHSARKAHAEAVDALSRALSLHEAGTDRRATAQAVRALADVHLETGDFAKALAGNERALALSEAVGDNSGAAWALLSIAVVHTYLGDFAKALAVNDRALAALEALGDARGAAMVLCNVGVVHASLGDHDRALHTYERALTAQQAVGDRASVATTLGNIGNAHLELEDPARALEAYRAALEAREALGDVAAVGRSHLLIGMAQLRTGELDAALASCEQGLALVEEGGDRRGVVAAHLAFGLAHEKAGALSKAVASLDRAARLAERLGVQHMLVQTLQSLSALRLRTGDAGRALADAHRAVTLLKSLVGRLGEEQGATARGTYGPLFVTGRLAAAAVDDLAAAAFFLESGRAGSLLESLGARDALRWASLPEDLRQAEVKARGEEARAWAAYEAISTGNDLVAVRAKAAALDAARTQVAEVVERIQREAKKEAQLWYPVAAPLEDLQGFLGDGEALVLYGLGVDDQEAHALVLTRKDARIVGLGRSDAVEAACRELDVSDPASDPTAALNAMRRLVVAPLALPAGIRRWYVSPDGPLAYVPFSALADGIEVVFAASGTTHGELRAERSRRGTQVLAIADPDYAAKFDPAALSLYGRGGSEPGPVRGGRGGRLSPLPGTRAEAEAIGDVKLLGREATETGLRAALAAKSDRWRAVHFACHGLVDPDRPTLSSLALTPGAGADGFLTALEVLRMTIPADLVVLSACETGRGKIASGEGIVGLTRAFMFAGAPRVVCSLWKVDDEATRALMIAFYEAWNPRDGSPGVPAAEALRRAQAHLRADPKWKHPYYWAAWVLWGLP